MTRAILFALWSFIAVSCSGPMVRDPDRAPDKAAMLNVQLGIAYIKEGNFNTAMSKLKRAERADPSLPAVHNALGILYLRLNKKGKAEHHLQRAVKLAPQDSSVLNNYGQFLCNNGRPEEGIKYFMQAVENPLYRTPEFATSNAGICAMRNDDLESAEIYLRQALTANPKFSVALYKMSELSYVTERYMPARAYLQRYLEVTSHDANTLWLGIRIERRLGDKNAESSYAMALRNKFPDSEQTRLLIKSEVR